jgi:hypothetical protein
MAVPRPFRMVRLEMRPSLIIAYLLEVQCTFIHSIKFNNVLATMSWIAYQLLIDRIHDEV